MRQDACTLWGTGGYSAKLRFWWQIRWDEIHSALPSMIQDKKIHINALELVAIVINYYAAIVAFAEMKLSYQPVVESSGDNTTAVAHVKAFTNPSNVSQAVAKILASGHKYSDVGLNVGFYPGSKNFFADAISRGPPHITMHSKFKSLCPSNTAACLCLQAHSSDQMLRLRHFRLKPNFTLQLSAALLFQSTSQVQRLDASNCGHFVPEHGISFNFCDDWTWTLH